MLTRLADIFRQYRMMISRAEKRRRGEESARILEEVVARLKPGELAFDCGANVGNVTARLAETGAEIHAFEPDPVAFESLQQRFAGMDNVHLHNAAVGVRDGEIELFRDRSFHKNPLGRTTRSTVVPGGRRMQASSADAVSVKLVNLPAILAERLEGGSEIAFLKLDIEGAELDVLEALEAAGTLDRIRHTVAETHEKKFPALRPRFRRLRRDIESRYAASKVNLDWN